MRHSNGHGELAHDIREIIDKAQKEKMTKLHELSSDLRGLVMSEEPDITKVSFSKTDRFTRSNRAYHS
jgi:hypothetical protein